MEKYKILVADDNKDLVNTLKAVIEENIISDVCAVNSGQEALRVLLKNEIDLIILDVKMPDLDGFEVAETIRKRHETELIPIIFLTGHSKNDINYKKGLSLGAFDYLYKPVDTFFLINKIKIYLSLMEKERKLNKTLKHEVEAKTIQLKKELKEKELLENKLKKALVKLEKENRDKVDFLANVSHEIKNPLNGILGISNSLLIKYKNDEKLIKSLKLINYCGERLLGLTNDLLTVSMINCNEIYIKNEEITLRDIVSYVKDFFTEVIQSDEAKSKIVILRNISNIVPKFIYCDKDKLTQILFNLVGNAVKFTKFGYISINVEVDNDRVYFTISDTGKGIHENNLALIMERFKQEDLSLGKLHEGVGLGLSITKGFLDKMEGDIKIESEFNKGTNITISLPIDARNIKK